MTMPDLELVSTDDLIAELLRRMDHAVFSGLRVTVENEDGTSDNNAVHAWTGCSVTCAGLAGEAQFRILRSRCQTEPIDAPLNNTDES